MTDKETNRNWSEIERPYNNFLLRSIDSEDRTLSGTESSDDKGASIDKQANVSGNSGATSNGSVETMPVKNEGSIGDVWIKNFIRSKNWKPKKAGFNLDGLTGKAEFTGVFISGEIEALLGTIGGWTISSTAIHKDGATDVVSSGLAPADYPFYAGKKYVDRATAPFRVTPAGAVSLLCSEADAITIQHGSDILLEHGGDIKFTSVIAPTACTATLVATDVGNVEAGAHIYKVTYVNESGETELGTASNTVTTDATHLQVDLTAIPVSTSGSVTSRKIYRTKAGGTDYYLLTTISNNIVTTYTDNIADASLIGESANNLDNDSFGKIIIDGIESFSLEQKNTFVGRYSGNSNKTGYWNTAFGYYSLFSNEVGESNTAFGYAVLRINTTGYANNGIGTSVLFNNTTGYRNNAVGYRALFSNTGGYDNTANGSYSLYSNTTGYFNTANGGYSLYSNTTGYLNVANGGFSLYSNTTGYSNIANGYASLYSNTTGYRNIAIGYRALNNTTGYQNIAIGYRAGNYETGSNAFYINNQDRTDTAGDKTKSILYGVMAAATADQRLTVNAILIKSVQAGITAFATGGQASAVLLTANIVEISVCATAGDSVKLPVAGAGMEIKIVNHGAASCDVFPNTDDKINEAAANTAKALAVDASLLCVCWDADNWECLTMAR